VAARPGSKEFGTTGDAVATRVAAGSAGLNAHSKRDENDY
jgi:hypothetical protein